MSKHSMGKANKIKKELEKRGCTVRVTSKGHYLITDPATGVTTMFGPESLNGRNNKNIHNTKSQLKRVNAQDINLR